MLEKVYARPVESSGASFHPLMVEGAVVRVRFTHAEGLTAKDGAPRNFAVAGTDKKFVWAEAKVVGDAVVVSSPEVPQPVAVRYAQVDNPSGCNVYNASGPPAAPFRTDDGP